jgi:SNO glutamine amidotransferase family
MLAELAAARSDRSPPTSPRIGVLSVQGAFAAHGHVLSRMGATVVRVRAPSDLEVVEGLVLPGGKSTAMILISRSNGLRDALDEVLRSGIPVLAARTILASFHPELTTDTRVHLMAFGPLLGARTAAPSYFPRPATPLPKWLAWFTGEGGENMKKYSKPSAKKVDAGAVLRLLV